MILPALTWGLAAELLLKYGPTAVVWYQKMRANIDAGKEQAVVSDADIAELLRLGAIDPEKKFTDAGITLPPSKPTP